MQHNFMQKAIDSIKDYTIFTLDAEGKVLSWNKGAQQINGYQADEIIHQPFNIFFERITITDEHPKHLLQQAVKYGSYQEECWYVCKEGTRFWANVTITPIYDDNHQQLLGYTVITKDLSERLEAQNALKTSEERYKALLKATRTLTWQRDKTGAFIEPQPAWEFFTGQTWEQYRGMGWLTAHHPDIRGKMDRCWLEHTAAFEMETRLWSQQAQDYRYTLVRVNPQLDGQGQVQCWMGIELEVEQLKQTENQLREALERLSLTVESAQIGLWSWNLTTQKVTVDTNIIRYFAIDPKTFQGTAQEVFGQIHEKDCERVKNEIDDAIKHNKLYNTEFRVINADGTISYIAGRGTVRRDTHGHAKELFGINWDVTERKLLEEERTRAHIAEEQRTLQEAFIDTICHEIRNPLNGIMGSLEDQTETLTVMSNAFEKPELTQSFLREQQESVRFLQTLTKTLKDCSEHQHAIVNQVLELSRLDAKQVKPEIIPFALNKTLQGIAQMYKSQMQQKQQRLTLQLPKIDYHVESDGTRFKQIIMNLLKSAIFYTSQGGYIKLSLIVEPSSIEADIAHINVQVTDSGIGFTEEEKQQLFNRYSQISRSKHLKYDSSGLGLIISKQLAELLGGELRIDSTKWQGTTFTASFRWTLTKAPAISPPNPPSPESPVSPLLLLSLHPEKKNIGILIVEDNIINQKVFSSMLQKAGYNCNIASDGIEAIEKYQSFKPQLIFMDIEMPKKDGFEATKAIRTIEQKFNLPIIPIYAVTGYAREDFKTKAKEVGMNGFINKPFNREAIYNVIIKEFNQTSTSQSSTFPVFK